MFLFLEERNRLAKVLSNHEAFIETKSTGEEEVLLVVLLTLVFRECHVRVRQSNSSSARKPGKIIIHVCVEYWPYELYLIGCVISPIDVVSIS